MIRPGDVIYRVASLFAGLIAPWALWGYFFDANSSRPIIQVVPLLFAGVIWLLAWLGRDFLAEH
jgi:hypothetical protein